MMPSLDIAQLAELMASREHQRVLEFDARALAREYHPHRPGVFGREALNAAHRARAAGVQMSEMLRPFIARYTQRSEGLTVVRQRFADAREARLLLVCDVERRSGRTTRAYTVALVGGEAWVRRVPVTRPLSLSRVQHREIERIEMGEGILFPLERLDPERPAAGYAWDL